MEQELSIEQKLMKMNTHEVISLETHYIMRVIGGWIYTDRRGENAVGTFVPDPQA